MPNKPTIDPWLLTASGEPDIFAGTVDFGMSKSDEIELDEHPVLQPEIIAGPPAPSDDPEVPVEQPPAPPVEPEPEGPEVFEVEDGTVTLEKERGQWKATLVNSTGGNPQIYWGKNKNELLINTMKAQLNATAKIRELNKKAKLAVATPRQAPVQQPVPTVRDLTADESFEIKTLLESNPGLALDTLFQKKTGLNMQQLVDLAQKGAQANMNLETEAISRDFLNRNPDYYPDSENKNFQSLIKWLAKFKLGKNATEANAGEVFQELWQTGNYTVENLEEAYQDLTDDGMLVKPRLPKTPPPVEVLPEPVPAPAPSNSRIVSQTTRPRAALGLGRNDVSATPPPATPTAPTDEDLDNLPDDQISALLKGVRRMKVAARRSN